MMVTIGKSLLNAKMQVREGHHYARSPGLRIPTPSGSRRVIGVSIVTYVSC